MLIYLLRYFGRQWRRVSLTFAGVSISIAAIVFAYGVSGWVDSYSSHSLSHVLGDSTIWVVPGNGVALDPHTGLIVPKGVISEDTVSSLKATGIRWTTAVAAAVLLDGSPVVLYGDERYGEGSGLIVSQDLWNALGAKPKQVLIGEYAIWAGSSLTELPPRSVLTSLGEARKLLKLKSGASWLLSNEPRPMKWSPTLLTMREIKVTNSPALQEGPNSLSAIVYLTEGTVARFDPFTFRTKFSALTINTAMATLFGLVARIVFLFGAALAVTSTLVGVRERRDEIALFAVTGFQSHVLSLFLAEACLTQVVCFLLGGAIGLTMLRLALRSDVGLNNMAAALAFGSVYLPVLIVLTTLIPSQTVASRSPVELIRRNL